MLNAPRKKAPDINFAHSLRRTEITLPSAVSSVGIVDASLTQSALLKRLVFCYTVLRQANSNPDLHSAISRAWLYMVS
jgi:hypothetical protein